MRIKFLSVIVSFLVVSMAVSSCLDTENNYEYSSDATVHAFGLDTVHGRHYQFTIDQLQNYIYNRDSLPVGSDTIIDRILIDTFLVNGWITSGTPKDTLFSIEDSVSLLPAMNKGLNGMEFTAHAADATTTRKYKLEIRVHQQDPDSLEWREMSPFSTTAIAGKQKAVTLKSQSSTDLWVYTSATTAYKTSTTPGNIGWEAVSVTGLPAETRLTSMVTFRTTDAGDATKEALYAVTKDNKVYRSENGSVWQEVATLGSNVKAVIAAFPDVLTGIVEINGKEYFNISKDGLSWEEVKTDDEGSIALNEVPDTFPADNIYTSDFLTTNGIAQAMAVGTPKVNENEQTLIWLTMNGSDWAEISSTSFDAYCPKMESPFAMYYGGLFYCFGDELNDIYSSITGISWHKIEKKFMMPKELKDNTAPYSVCVDENNFIWIVLGGENTENKVWRGRLNKLGFKEQ